MIRIGSIVRIYYDGDSFDEGEVIASDHDYVVVDFYDWIERWPATPSAFDTIELYLEAKVILAPKARGDIIVNYEND